MIAGIVAGAVVLVALASARNAGVAGRSARVRRRTTAGAVVGTALPGVRAPAWLRRHLIDADIAVAPEQLVRVWAVSLVGAPAAALALVGPGLAIAAGSALCVGPLVALRIASGRRAARLEAALPLGLEVIARTLRTGGSLRQGIEEAARSAPHVLVRDLERVALLVQRGAPLSVALDEWAVAAPLPGVRLAAAALSLGAETGGAQARAIDGVAATIRDRLAAAADVRAQATQARVSAAVIALSPLAFSALASATDARTAAFLFKEPLGIALLLTGLALDAAGALWMARLTRPAR